MAEKNLSGAIFELKEKERARKRRQNPASAKKLFKLPYRSRSFDLFFTFGMILLGFATFLQLAAIILFQ